MGFIEVKDLTKVYKSRGIETTVLDKVNFFVKKGEFCVLTGPSGSGKTTLMNILAGMDTATEGVVEIDGQEITSYDERDLETYRRTEAGYVMPSDNLIPTLTLRENMELAAKLISRPFDPARALENVDLEDMANQFPAQLTPAQCKKAAIARAMVKHSRMILLDEPLMRLNCGEGKDVLNTLYEICTETGKTILLATANETVAEMADRVVRLRDGRVNRKYLNKNRKEIGDIAW